MKWITCHVFLIEMRLMFVCVNLFSIKMKVIWSAPIWILVFVFPFLFNANANSTQLMIVFAISICTMGHQHFKFGYFFSSSFVFLHLAWNCSCVCVCVLRYFFCYFFFLDELNCFDVHLLRIISIFWIPGNTARDKQLPVTFYIYVCVRLTVSVCHRQRIDIYKSNKFCTLHFVKCLHLKLRLCFIPYTDIYTRCGFSDALFHSLALKFVK